MTKFGFNYLLTLDDVIESRGGISLWSRKQDHRRHWLLRWNWLEDEVVCMAGLAESTSSLTT